MMNHTLAAEYHILVLDDDQDIQSFLQKMLLDSGFKLTTASSAAEAFQKIKTTGTRFDVILSDVRMPGMTGLEFLAEFKKLDLPIPVILMTAFGSVEAAVTAMKNGAFDYILKPINVNELKISIERALRFSQLEQDNSALRDTLKQGWKTGSIIGKSRGMQSVFDLITRVAPTHANVLVTGESGTGKELVARAIHQNSPRAEMPFIPINCSAIPGELLESELFGHAKGSFTGAHQAKKGLFEEGNGGTIFLDEIGDMDPALQAKLLRVLQERKIKPVGDNKYRDIDVRIVAATHKDLRAAIKENRFREDLYYRLCVIPIEIPPLRQRKEDIPVLAEHFLKKHAAAHSLSVRGFTPSGMARLMTYKWEGNVRELENVIERSLILCPNDRISEEDLPSLDVPANSSGFLDERHSDFLTLKEIEKQYIELILRKTGGKKERAAHILGIDRKTLRRKERTYGLASAEAGSVDLDGNDGEGVDNDEISFTEASVSPFSSATVN